MNKDFLKPKYWGIWIGVFFIKILVILPFRWQLFIASGLSNILYILLKKRKFITLRNIEAAFPDLSIKSQRKLCKDSMRSGVIGLFEMLFSWFASDKQFQRLNITMHNRVKLESMHDDNASGIILLGSHFHCMELAGRYTGSCISGLNIVYQKHNNPLMEHFITTKRSCDNKKSLQRKNVISIIKQLRRKKNCLVCAGPRFWSSAHCF